MSLRDIIVGTIAATLIASPVFAQEEMSEYQYQPPENYIGIGGIVTLEDNSDVNVLVNSKFKLTTVNPSVTLSARPGVSFGDGNTLVNLPLTFEGTVAPRVHPYAGAGIQLDTNNGNEADVNALLTAGVDVNTSRNTILNIGVNYTPDADSEVSAAATFGYRF